MSVLDVRYWPKGKPLPRGWREGASLEGSNHGRYARIIVRKPGVFGRLKTAVVALWRSVRRQRAK